MPFPILPLIGLGASALGGLFGKDEKQSSTSTSSPTLSPAFQPLQQLLIQQAMARLQQPSGLPQGYESQGIAGINHTASLADMALQNRLRSRGLGRSNIAGAADAKLEGARLGEISRFQTGLPMLERDMRNEDLGFAQGLLPLGRGTTTTSTGKGSTGGGAGGAFEDFGSMLGYLIGRGAFAKGGK